MSETQKNNKKTMLYIRLAIFVIFAAIITFLTVMWGISYHGLLNREKPDMVGAAFALLIGFELLMVSILWLFICGLTLYCGLNAKVKFIRFAQMALFVYTLLGLVALWTVFLILRFT